MKFPEDDRPISMYTGVLSATFLAVYVIIIGYKRFAKHSDQLYYNFARKSSLFRLKKPYSTSEEDKWFRCTNLAATGRIQ